MKEEILKLRNQGYSYNEIKKILGCSKSTISYHCSLTTKENKTKKNKEYFAGNFNEKKELNCLFCNGIISKFGKKFCSTQCSNSSRKKEEKEEKRLKRIQFNNYKIKFSGFSGTELLKKISDEKLLNVSIDTLSWDRLRKRVILEQEGKCKKCDLDKWLGVNIVLEVDHIDGNRKNNLRSNLVGLCPNCHSLS